ncbi:MAG: hypothetical protein RSD95_02930 [Clostridia bacterium]
MSKTYLIPAAGRFYKANFHCHTTNSDGIFTPEQVRSLYLRNGYSVVAFTDHWTYADMCSLSRDDFLALCGYELNYDWRELNTDRLFRTCHICAIARDPAHCTPIPGLGEYNIASINEAIRRLNENGFIVNLNHTAWSAMPTQDILSMEGITGMEMYNATCAYGYGDTAEYANYEMSIRCAKRWLPIAADDNHLGLFDRETPIAAGDCCTAYMMIKSERLAYKDILDAYLAGHYYCSTGPTIYALYLEDDCLCVDCSPVFRAQLRTKYITFIETIQRQQDTLTHVAFDIGRYREDTPYVIVQLTDQMGRFACTVPYYFHSSSTTAVSH